MTEFFDVVKLGANIGARIDGVRLAGDLDAETVAAINEALLEHKVIFFRDQHDLDDDGQLAFASKLGTPTTAHPTLSRGRVGAADRLALRQGQQLAHRRHVRRPHPESVAAAGRFAAQLRRDHHLGVDRGGLRAVARAAARADREPVGGAHQQYDYAADYDGRHEELTDTVREYREEFVSRVLRDRASGGAGAPETGKRVLLLGHFIKQFVGLGPTESATLFGLLQARVTKLENTIRWNWQPGDLAIWDNRATQHYAVADYDDQYRRLNRVTLAGDIPVDVHGQRSRAVVGDASQYSDVVSPIALAS